MQKQNASTYFAEPEQDNTEQLNHVLQAGVLNELLRKQLTPSEPPQAKALSAAGEEKVEQENKTVATCAVAAVSECLADKSLAREQLHRKLSDLYYQQKALYEQTDIDPSLRNRQFISHCGLIMSPDHCVTTVLDDLRIRAFVRGVDQAINDMSAKRQGPIHIVYPACGPFAPLLLPLIAYYKANKIYNARQLRITLIDIQPGAVQSVEALVEQMGIKDYIRQICCIDALTYDPGERSVDMVVLEAMQHGLSREGQLLIARHFAAMLAEDGCFIPQKITVSAVLNRAQREYVEQWCDADVLSEQHMNADVKSERTVLGDILTLSRENLLSLKERVLDENTTLIECGKVDIPHLDKRAGEQTLLICTRIETYGNEVIGEYDSGITHPLPDQQVCINFEPREDRSGDLLLSSGDAIRFYYRMNGLPGFMATWAQGGMDG